jgi:hypothetical protein
LKIFVEDAVDEGARMPSYGLSDELWQNHRGVEVPEGIPLMMEIGRPAFLSMSQCYLYPVPPSRTERYG